MSGQLLVKLPQIANQNLTVDHGKPKIRPGSPVAKVKKKGQQVAATVPSPFAKAMSDTQLQHRKRISANTAIVTSSLGLGALGAHGGGQLLRHVGKVKKIPKLMSTGRKIQRAAVPVSLTSGGISGAAGYNYAGIQRAEAKKKVQKAYSPENNRRRRANIEGPAAIAAGVGAMGGAAHYARRVGGQQTRDLNTGKDILGRQTTKMEQARQRHSQAIQGVTETKGNFARNKDIRDKMNANPNATPGEKRAQTNVLRRHEGAYRAAQENVKSHEAGLGARHAKLQHAAKGVKQLTRIRRITGAKAGALAALGAGGVSGGLYLVRAPHTKSGQSYSRRYRPQQS